MERSESFKDAELYADNYVKSRFINNKEPDFFFLGKYASILHNETRFRSATTVLLALDMLACHTPNQVECHDAALMTWKFFEWIKMKIELSTDLIQVKDIYDWGGASLYHLLKRCDEICRENKLYFPRPAHLLVILDAKEQLYGDDDDIL